MKLSRKTLEELLEQQKGLDEVEINDEEVKKQGFIKSVSTEDEFNSLIASNKELQGFVDKKVTGGINTFKEKTMQKLIDAEVLKRTGKAETPEQKEIRELKARLDKADKEKTKAERMAKYKDVAAEKKIPANMIEYLLTDDDETTNANLDLFQNSMKTYIETQVKERLGGSSYTPPASGGATGKVTWDDVIKNPELLADYQKQNQ